MLVTIVNRVSRRHYTPQINSTPPIIQTTQAPRLSIGLEAALNLSGALSSHNPLLYFHILDVLIRKKVRYESYFLNSN